MSGNRTARHGRCHCGAVQFTAIGEPLFVAFCHCESCRRSTGGALVAACGFRREDVAFSGAAPTYYISSPGVRRGFCARCGTSLTFESARWPDDVHLMVGNFDSPESFAPQCTSSPASACLGFVSPTGCRAIERCRARATCCRRSRRTTDPRTQFSLDRRAILE